MARPSGDSSPRGETSNSVVKHLEFIQAVITRQANNSFLVKGWSLTVVAVMNTVATSGRNDGIVAVSFLPILAFWWLDAFFLRQERLFRRLYDEVRKPGSSVEPFSMDTTPYGEADRLRWWRVLFSRTLVAFHGLIVIISLIMCLTLSLSSAKTGS